VAVSNQRPLALIFHWECNILNLFSNFKWVGCVESSIVQRNYENIVLFSGPRLVSRYGDLGWTKNQVKL